MATSSIGTLTDSLSAEQLQRAYDLGHKDGLNCVVMGHASTHTVNVETRLARTDNELRELHRQYSKISGQNKLLKIVAAFLLVVVLYFLMKGWAA